MTRRIGDVEVGAVGFGAMRLSHAPERPSTTDAVATVHAALDAGVTLIDTADVYCLDGSEIGHNERLVARALAEWPGDADDVLVATKGGVLRPGAGWARDGSPAHLRSAAEASARALGVEQIGLYLLHWPDPDVPFAESVGALAELVDGGLVRAAGVSNVSPAQLEIAVEVLGERLVSVQNPYSVEDRWAGDTLDRCTELGLAFLPWGPFAGLSGAGSRAVVTRAVAAELGSSAQQVALAWLLARSPVMVPIPGATRVASVRDSAAAADLELPAECLARIDQAAADPSRPTVFPH
jgi:aryl-alcohol dehydrogenase-like predicted oxidoreductase